MKKILNFIKTETVLCAACVLAVISSIIVKPDAAYIQYIDFRTLALLFSLMCVMAGLRELGIFSSLAGKMLSGVKNMRQLLLILVMLCFFCSMIITNDVALITFVPFTFTVLDILGKDEKKRLIIPVTVMQTVAANLGSMLTPMGNPQNLYLYGKSSIGFGEFIMIMLPYTLLAFVMLFLWCIIKGKNKTTPDIKLSSEINIDKRKTIMYLMLLGVCMLCVVRIIDYKVMLAVTAVCIIIFDKGVFKNVDYSLIATFIGFFIFIGNMGRISSFCIFLEERISGHEFVTAAAASQVISNVPAALLLSGFTDNIRELIIGTNIGGLGTLIASMASLISYKAAGREDKSIQKKYQIYFGAVNIAFLVAMFTMYYVYIII